MASADGGSGGAPGDDAEAQQRAPTPNDIQHRPRKRASGPSFSPKVMKLVEGDTPAAQEPPTNREEWMIAVHDQRIGHEYVKYATFAGASTIAYTYLTGFWHLFNKNKAGWHNTFRQRLFLMSPLMTMYATGHGVVPMPFKRYIEAAVGRPALSTMDVMSARDALRKAAAQA